MATKNFSKVSAKEFNTTFKNAKNEVKGIFTSPFVIVNQLNKAAKGDFSKIENCDNLLRENIAAVAKVVKSLHTGRYAFNLDLFVKDYAGRFCTMQTLKNECVTHTDYMDICGVSAAVAVDNKGREVCKDENGNNVIFTPIACTISAYFAAFAKVAKVTLVASEKAEKQAAKDEKKAAKDEKIYNKAFAAVSAVFGEFANTFTRNEVLAKYALIKGTK